MKRITLIIAAVLAAGLASPGEPPQFDFHECMTGPVQWQKYVAYESYGPPLPALTEFNPCACHDRDDDGDVDLEDYAHESNERS